jgi:hypothetical protein
MGMMVSVMAMSAEDWLKIDETLAGAMLEAGLVPALRQRFPHFVWTSCDASDVAETPYRVYGDIELHLLNTANHCAEITSDLANATGIILAGRNRSL